MSHSPLVNNLRRAIRTDRILETATALIEVPSPTQSAAAVADRLASILERDGSAVERVDAGWPNAPAVVARFDSGQPGPTLQFNGHLDTVHLPFVPPRIDGGILYGSGASDMKGGIAAMIEAARALRDAHALERGSILITAHDLHEAPWGDGSQVDGLIDAGCVGDAVLLPEYLSDCLPVAGRGLGVIEVAVRREGEPLHEVLGGIDQPSVIAAGAELVRRFADFDRELSQLTHPIAGRESLFVGQVHSGEIYNQAPTEFRLSGTRRWLPGSDVSQVERKLRDVLAATAAATGTTIDGQFQMVRDGFELDAAHPAVEAFQSASSAVMGRALPAAAKPFVDDGNTFSSRARIPAITHGPNAKGAHTLHEEVPVAELERVALVYALTAVAFCNNA
jgi:acetylornithine deacetylase/succinyl-diaminopimelate desuccinylase-like protein